MGRVLQPFEYFEPLTLDQAGSLSRESETVLLAGGCELVPSMRRRLLRPRRLVSLMRIAGLDRLAIDPVEGLEVGAQVPISHLDDAKAIAPNWTALYESIQGINPRHIRNMGTLVGNLCGAVAFYDIPTALTALEADLVVHTSGTERVVALEDFYTEPRRTALAAGEIVTLVRVPPSRPRQGSAFSRILKARRHADDLQKVSAAVRVAIDPSGGAIEDARVVVGCCNFRPLRLEACEAAIAGAPTADETWTEIGRAAAAAIAPMTDLEWIETVRRDFVAVLVRDALATAASRATGTEPPDGGA